MNEPTLKPCPNPDCGGEPVLVLKEGFVFCQKCNMAGPLRDQTGAKWNALPRREDPQPDARRAERLHVAAVLMAGDWACPNGGGTSIPNIVKAAAALIAEIDRKEVAK